MKSSILSRGIALLALFCLCLLPARAAPGPERTVVLVHGAFADGSCWVEVIRMLQARGVNVVSVQNPLVTLAGDVTAVHRVLNQQTAPVVLVGHSWGGVVATEAGTHPKVTSLVYVAAFAPNVGESVFSLLQGYPPQPWLGGIVTDGAGYQTLSQDTFLTYFSTGLPARQAQALFAVQQPTFAGTLFETATQAAWHSKPSWYVVADNDQIIPPDLQRAMAARMQAQTTSVTGSGHLPMFSHPAKVAHAILAAVRAP